MFVPEQGVSLKGAKVLPASKPTALMGIPRLIHTCMCITWFPLHLRIHNAWAASKAAVSEAKWKPVSSPSCTTAVLSMHSALDVSVIKGYTRMGAPPISCSNLQPPSATQSHLQWKKGKTRRRGKKSQVKKFQFYIYIIFFFKKSDSSQDSEEPNSKAISGHFLLFAGWRNSWFSYRGPAVGARVPSQPVVVVGQMAVWIVSHKPWCAGHLLMETNETKTRMRNESRRGGHREMKMVCNTACKSNRKFKKRAKWGVAAAAAAGSLLRGTVRLSETWSRETGSFGLRTHHCRSWTVVWPQRFRHEGSDTYQWWLKFKCYIKEPISKEPRL